MSKRSSTTCDGRPGPAPPPEARLACPASGCGGGGTAGGGGPCVGSVPPVCPAALRARQTAQLQNCFRCAGACRWHTE
eukprot:15453903-Alexandrium_andersonii.AAC.1